LTVEAVKSLCDSTVPKGIEPAAISAPLSSSAGSQTAAVKATAKAVSADPLIKILDDPRSTLDQRIETVLNLGKMRKDAKEAVPALVKMMEGILEQEGARPPRIEDHLRNALLRTLLDIDRNDERVKDVLSKGLTEPLARPSNLSSSRYFSQGELSRDTRAENDNGRAYTPVATWNEYTFQVGTAEMFKSATAISAEDYQKVVAGLAADFPDAKTWRKDNASLYRLKITKTGPDGNIQSAFLEGESFVFDGSDAKVQGWSIAADKDGFLHLMGGQHNAPNPANYIPGSWERMGLSRNSKDNNYPAQMYWVSRNPGDITSFVFAGRKEDPRSLPTSYWNYMNFVQDREGELYTYGRINIAGLQSWGLYRYDTSSHEWEALGGDASKLVANGKAAHPDWSNYLIRQVRGPVPVTPQPNTLVWAWMPNFYNFCRAPFGIYFDITNRMHVNMRIRGVGESGQIIDSHVYAWSDDGGKTFCRADGTPLALPLTISPAPDHNADVNSHDTLKWWELWTSLLKEAGYSIPKFN
ncbi:MAG TPA: hypothetical protein DD727_01205, partial [Clostridiales bacterium]|nr:hypothetical protein [Clostridiales bacterium]